VTTHLDYQYEDGRVFETEQLLAGLNDVSGPLIVVGTSTMCRVAGPIN
jgi:hypothetical protein